MLGFIVAAVLGGFTVLASAIAKCFKPETEKADRLGREIIPGSAQERERAHPRALSGRVSDDDVDDFSDTCCLLSCLFFWCN